MFSVGTSFKMVWYHLLNQNLWLLHWRICILANVPRWVLYTLKHFIHFNIFFSGRIWERDQFQHKKNQRASLVAQMVKHLPEMQETGVWSLGWEDPLEKEMATHSSILAWKIPWTEEPGRLQSMGSQRVGHDWAISLLFTSLVAVDEKSPTNARDACLNL